MSPPATEKASGKLLAPNTATGPERDVAQPQVRPRQRLSLGHGGVDAQVQPFAPAHHVGEQLELADRSAALALDAGARQPGLGAGALDERVAEIQDVGRDGLEEARPLVQAGLAIGVERVPGQRAGSLHLLGPANAKAGSIASPVAGLIARNDRSRPGTRCAPIKMSPVIIWIPFVRVPASAQSKSDVPLPQAPNRACEG